MPSVLSYNDSFSKKQPKMSTSQVVPIWPYNHSPARTKKWNLAKKKGVSFIGRPRQPRIVRAAGAKVGGWKEKYQGMRGSGTEKIGLAELPERKPVGERGPAKNKKAGVALIHENSYKTKQPYNIPKRTYKK